MQQAFEGLYNDLVADSEGDEAAHLQGKHKYVKAVKEAFRQLLKVSLLSYSRCCLSAF